jgi:type IV pilus assembly protein PilM
MASKSAIGLDIGTRMIKALEIQGKLARYNITEFARLDVDPEQPLADQVRKVFEGKNFNLNGTIVTSVSGKNVFVRHHIMGSVIDPRELRESVKYEIGKFIPLQDINELLYDCHKLEDLPPNEKGERDMRLLVAGSRRAHLDTFLAMLEGAQIEPEIVDVDACALNNSYAFLSLVNPMAIDPKKTVGLVEVGATKVNVHIVRNWDSFFARESYKAGDDVSDAISKRFALGFKEAEQMKIKPGDNLLTVLESVETVVLDICNDIRSSIDYFEAQYEVPVDEILLTGGGCNTPGLSESLEKICQKKVAKWRPVEQIERQLSPEAEKDLREYADHATIALGLAARMAEPDFTEARRPNTAMTASVPIVLLPDQGGTGTHKVEGQGGESPTGSHKAN